MPFIAPPDQCPDTARKDRVKDDAASGGTPTMMSGVRSGVVCVQVHGIGFHAALLIRLICPSCWQTGMPVFEGETTKKYTREREREAKKFDVARRGLMEK